MAKRRGRNNVCVWEQSPASSDIPSCSIQAKDAADIQPGLCRLNAPAKAHYTESVRPMLESLCQRDPGLHRRTTDTSILVLELARGAGMDAEEVAAVQRAALFHVVASASPRPGDSAHVAGQPAATIGAGERLARQMAPFELEISYLRHQTEHYDGRGLPAGLAGNAIPLGARILAVADAYHQLISTGGGGKGMNHAEAMAELRRRAGSEFDPALVNFLVGARQKKPARPGTERRKNLP
jgi:HD-GYP domain-containing protein (c-di-GMP phosphodiesterase class II)